MVWVWIIVAIIVIALIIWFLMRGRSSQGKTPERQSQVGRHASAEGRTDAGSPGSVTGGAGTSGARGTGTSSATGTGAAGAAATPDRDVSEASTDSAMPADDSAAGVAAAPGRDVPEASTDSAMPADDSAAGVADAGGHDATSGTVHTTTNYGSAADPTPDSASAIPADGTVPTGPDAPTSAVPLVSQEGTGQESSALPADGSNEFDDVHDAVDTAPSPSGESIGAGSDEQIARENDDAMPRRSGAPAQSPAAATRHDDNELEATQVEHPAAGTVGAGDSVAASHDDEDEASGGDSHPASASAGQTVGYPVDSASDTPSADASASGKDPMTERFGDGAASTKPDGSPPAGYPIKGNADSMLFHTEDSPRYAATKPEVWFRDETAATSAGFAHWDRDKRGTAPSSSEWSGSGAGADSGASAGAGTSDVVASGTSYTVGTSHTEPAVTGLTGTSATDHSTGSAASDSTHTSGDASADAATDTEPDPMQEQFGAGAASPREDGSAPSERHKIKGNADSMLFHTEDSPHYEGTEAEVWFTDEDAATAAGFKHWDHRKR